MYPFVTTSVPIFWHLPISLVASYLLATWPAHGVWMAATFEPELISAPAACPPRCLPAVPPAPCCPPSQLSQKPLSWRWGTLDEVPALCPRGMVDAWGGGTGSGVACWTLGPGDGHSGHRHHKWWARILSVWLATDLKKLLLLSPPAPWGLSIPWR